MQQLKKFFKNKKGSVSIGIIANILFAIVMIPVISSMVINASANLTATESIILGLSSLFLILGIVLFVVKETGLKK